MIAFVIVAGGSGRRMNASVPKQYMNLGGMPILMHTLKHALMILSSEDRIILVVPRGDRAYVGKMIGEYVDYRAVEGRVHITEGGDTRTDSVRNGLTLVGDADVIAIHDSVRIFFTRSLLSDMVALARSGKIVIPVQESTDSIVLSSAGNDPHYIPRSEVLQVKTPQVFPADPLLHSYGLYNASEHGQYTDDASLVHALCPQIPLSVVRIPFFNNKITYPMDIEQALQALKSFDPLQ